MNKVLVLGGSGLVGRAIISEINKYKGFQVYATYFESSIKLNQNRSFKLNIEDLDNINCILNTIKPQSIISCLRGDYDKQLILHTKIAEYLKKSDGRLYFCSTTNVFDNDLSKPHYEDDLQNSCTDYGQYKIECEKRTIEILHDNACILRLPQVWGKDSPRMKQLLKLLTNNEKVVIYPKLFFNTNTDIVIAKKILYIIEHKLKGIFHLAAEDVISHKDFCNELIIGLGFNNIRIEENFKEEGYFALLSKRSNEFPEQLRLTNKEVVNSLVNV
ncbi:sugar nucleotide-binding protein [Wukongibacter sp. M2B1]|uniref:sugar nucleotide-binding protein n=1 Tax=Wukongibacter sp. M2B1 TaxID=3088895 RepID=UPI003D793EF8